MNRLIPSGRTAVGAVAKLLRPNFQARSLSQAASAVPAPLTCFNDEEVALRESVAKFATEHIKPKVRAMDANNKIDADLVKRMFDQGLMGIETPAELEGGGMSFMSSIIAIEELAKVDPAISVVVDVQNTLVNNCIRLWGTAEQHKQFLPRLATKDIGSFCLSEWGSGSDAFALKTKAVAHGDHYVLNGTKAWITNSGEANVFIVMANVDFSKGYKGITAFLVERGHPGLSIGKKEDKLGIRASSTCEVNLVDCKVHKSAVLGKVGEGYKIAIGILNEGRVGIAAQMLGLAEGAFNETVPYLHQRRQFNQPIADFQGMQFQIAECAVAIESAKLMTYNAARMKDAGLPIVKEGAMAKLYASQVAEKVASQCVNMLGGVGFTKEFPVEKFFRDCKIGQIYEGTSNIQLSTIAKLVAKEFA
eukprot:TRINITY_DN1716_c1_g1_i3.p2 TRINITY_DN1716_c1_g1~~TRINITY_DN1716_c1_g1_i3.p2  ORF type:complete len:419 (+),score=167.43 TRINITY_DN1716_c1_g1_i3:1461-2717(+)